MDVNAVLPAARAARRSFDRASARFADARVVHDEARDRLLERLQFVRLDPDLVVDLGCGTGEGAEALANAYPRSRVLAIDSSRGMLARVPRTGAAGERIVPVAGDAEQAPLCENTAGLVLANMLLPWCRPDALFAQAARVLAEPGLLLFSTVGPDTLLEVRRAWAAVDAGVHVHGFVEMHDLGDLAVRAGLQEPVLDVARIELTYTDVRTLVADLRASGAVNVAAGRRRGLTTHGLWQRFEQALTAQRDGERFAVTVELILGQAWGRAAAPQRQREDKEVAIPIERIRRRSG